MEEVLERGSIRSYPSSSSTLERFLVISLGTGSQKDEGKYTAKEAAKWGLLQWLTPIINVFSSASSNLVDLHLSVLLRALHSENNYLRIQDDASSDPVVATDKNLERLVEVSEELLDKALSNVNLQTGLREACASETNREALVRFAKLLSQEKSLRHCYKA